MSPCRALRDSELGGGGGGLVCRWSRQASQPASMWEFELNDLESR
jgi:hypothetical protein